MKTYKILKARYDGFLKQIASLNKKAKKLGCSPITVNVLREFKEPCKTANLGGETVVVTYLSYVEIELLGNSPKLSGWEVLAILSHTQSGNLLRVVPGKNLPTEYRTKEAHCDHCNVKRYRTDTYVLQHEDGKVVQVVSKCLKDFLGHVNVESLAKYAELLLSAEAKSQEDNDGTKVSHREMAFNLLAFLPFVAMIIRTHGWLSRSKAQMQGVVSTADKAFGAMLDLNKGELPTIADIEASYSSIEWAKEYLKKNNLSDYEFNLKQIVDSEIVDYRAVGFASSLIPFYKKETEKNTPKENKTLSEHFGVIGKRDTFTLKLIKAFDVEGTYGLTTIHHFEDEAGNRAVWFSSTGSDMKINETYKVLGTIKKHDEYKGTKQTVLSRCKVIDK